MDLAQATASNNKLQLVCIWSKK